MADSDTYAKLIGCPKPEDVHRRVAEWSSDLTPHEHLVRSVILEIHTNLESMLKKILYHHMVQLVAQTSDEKRNERITDELSDEIGGMFFSRIYKTLKPCLDSFDFKEFDDIPKINKLRNDVTHKDIRKASYKDRSPFTEHDSLAQLFFDGWTINKGLREFFEKRIEDHQAAKEIGFRYFMGLPLEENLH